MKIFLFLVISAISSLLLNFIPVYATTVSFPYFTTTSSLDRSFDASLTIYPGRLRLLVPGGGGKGAAYYNTTFTLGGNRAFSTNFAFEITSASGHGGDGLTFTLHNGPANAITGRSPCCNTTVVGGGSSLGYEGIRDSIAVEFDIYNDWFNDGTTFPKSPADHIAFNNDGSVKHTAPYVSAQYGTGSGASGFVNKGIWYAWIDYDGTNLVVYASQTNSRPATPGLTIPISSATMSSTGYLLSPTIRAGFTAGGGSSNSTITILSWTFSDFYNPSSVVDVGPFISNSFSMSVYDPTNTKKKAIPGNDLVHKIITSNEGGSPDPNSIKIIANIPSYLSFKIGSIVLTDGVGGNNSGLTCCNSIEYSSIASPYSWGYTPSGAYDPNVRAIRITPSGTMNSGVSGKTAFQIEYQAQIQ